MAKGLQCPGCGHKHRLDRLPSTATFRCTGCGQLLRNPARASVPSGAPPAPGRGVGAPGTRAAPSAEADRTAVMVAPPMASPRAPAAEGRAPVPSAPAAPGSDAAAPGPAPPGGDVAPRMSRVLRLLVWVLAVPLGGALALLGARLIGFVDGSRLIDMISGDGGWSRYTRAFVLVPIWALISAGLVQGAEHLRNRLRARRTATAADAGGGPEPAAVPVPSAQSSRRGRRAGS